MPVTWVSGSARTSSRSGSGAFRSNHGSWCPKGRSYPSSSLPVELWAVEDPAKGSLCDCRPFVERETVPERLPVDPNCFRVGSIACQRIPDSRDIEIMRCHHNEPENNSGLRRWRLLAAERRRSTRRAGHGRPGPPVRACAGWFIDGGEVHGQSWRAGAAAALGAAPARTTTHAGELDRRRRLASRPPDHQADGGSSALSGRTRRRHRRRASIRARTQHRQQTASPRRRRGCGRDVSDACGMPAIAAVAGGDGMVRRGVDAAEASPPAGSE